MARDWRKVALAVVAASAFASGWAQDWEAAAQQANRPAKSAKSKQPPKSDSDDAEKGAAKKKRQDPADAQRAVENAAKLLQTGKAEQAEQLVSATLAAGSLPPAIMARALYVRGMAYREQKKPAQAISDLTSALWLKGGLSAEDRADALKQRTAAYADAGLTETGALASSPSGEPARPSAGKSWGTVTTPTGDASPKTAQSSDGDGNWFKNWFGPWSSPGGGQTSANAPAAAAPPATASIEKADSGPARPSQNAHAPRISTAWSSKTEVRPAEAPTRTAASGPEPPKADGKYRVQLATVRTQREAQALAAKAKQALAFLAQDPEIDQAVLGNMGSFYRVRVGPFGTIQEAQAVCAKVKGSGFDCLAVSQ
jgi:cell division septation protein DedD